MRERSDKDNDYERGEMTGERRYKDNSKATEEREL